MLTAETQRAQRNPQPVGDAACFNGQSSGSEVSVNELTHRIIGASIEVHQALGPGLLESAYEECLCRELELCGLPFERQVALPLNYKNVQLSCGYRVDLLVDRRVVVEIKAVDRLMPIHEAQLLTYLRLGRWRVGLIINFNVPVLRDGIRRCVLDLEEQ